MHTYAHHQHSMRKASGEAPHVRPTSFLKTLGTALSSKALTCHISTAAANEHVPSNDSGFLIPFWQVRGGELAGRGSQLLMFHLHCKCWLLPCAAALSPAVQLRCFLHSCRHPGGRLLLYLGGLDGLAFSLSLFFSTSVKEGGGVCTGQVLPTANS